MDIKQKDEIEINNSNLKDFLEQDLRSLEFILSESEDFISDLIPVSIFKLKTKITQNPVYSFLDYYREIKNYTRKKLTKI